MKLSTRFRLWLAYLISRYIMPDYEAHKLAALHNTSANEVYYRNEAKRWKQRAQLAEKHVDMFCDVNDRIVKMAMNVPDGEMTPFVHESIVTLENARRYV